MGPNPLTERPESGDEPVEIVTSARGPMRGLWAWIVAVRPRTLVIGATPVLVGLAVAWHAVGRLEIALGVPTLPVALAIHKGEGAG